MQILFPYLGDWGSRRPTKRIKQKTQTAARRAEYLKNSQDCHPIVSRLLYQPLKSPENQSIKGGTSFVIVKLKNGIYVVQCWLLCEYSKNGKEARRRDLQESSV